MAPITCTRGCGNTAGPFEPRPEGPVCEDCLDKEQDR